MPTTGAYQFRKAQKADARGVVPDENDIAVGEWGWEIRAIKLEEGEKHYLLLMLRDPDCKELCTLWRRFGTDVKGHDIDAQGNVTPSVFHQWPYGDPPRERCGFHTQPTKLLDFVDIR
jgi:hypothetical protein